MPETKYLYGASVVGIQQFIFQTDKLKDIAGASEIVQQICTRKFSETVGSGFDDESAIINAAGNIRYIFKDEEECRKVVREFPRKVVNYAPGISICQAVVELGDDYVSASDLLEKCLKAQRNRNLRSTTLGLVGMERCGRTGLPAIPGGEDFQDAGTCAKQEALRQVDLCRKSFGLKELDCSQIPFEMSDLEGADSWIAVIHADGNGLGQIVRKIGKDKDRFRKFSRDLDKATEKSANEAFNAVKNMFAGETVIPIRPVVLGGDDLTVICRADIAVPYVKAFLESFEENTRAFVPEGTFSKEPEKAGLTACAGIAFIKSSFPFHYGYDLAEDLCSAAKKDAKDSDAIRNGEAIPQSCLMFHKVQGSFTGSYQEIVARELKPNDRTSFNYGPYYLKNKDGRMTVDDMNDNAKYLLRPDSGSVRTHLRRWVSGQYDNPDKADQMLGRAVAVTRNKNLWTMTEKDARGASPAYDILSIYGVTFKDRK